MGAAGREELLAALRRFQSDRMRGTHAALLAHPVYRPLCEFFLGDLYGTRDFGSSADTLSSLAHLLRPVLGHRLYQGAVDLVELQRLSAALDERLARALLERGAALPLDRRDVEAALQACDDRPHRLRQVELSSRCTELVHELSGRRSTARLLAVARRLGRLERFHAVLATLERGYRALRGVDDIRPFVDAMRGGEVGYLESVLDRRGSGNDNLTG